MTNKQFMSFESVQIPRPTEIIPTTDNKWVDWGTDNLYPKHILNLYNSIPTHQSIINGKAAYIIANGLAKVGGEKLKLNVNANDTIDSFLKKITLDYLLFSSFAVEVIYNKMKKPIEFHFIPAQKLRMNESKSKFWYSKNWEDGKKKIEYDRWTPGTKDSKSKIFFHENYVPSDYSIYPTPEYFALNKTLQTFLEIIDFNLHNIQNHFSPSKIITFFDKANLDENSKAEILRNLKKSYTGSTGMKYIIDFVDGGPDAKGADVQNLSAGDWDKFYEAIRSFINDQLYKGHSIISPLLFGDKTQGQLGGATEMKEAYEIYRDTYITGKRNEITSALNLLFEGFAEIGGEVEFSDKEFFSRETKKEEKPVDNKVPDEDPDQEAKTSDEANAEFSSNVYQLSEQDFEKIKDMGSIKEDFEMLMEMDDVFSAKDAEAVHLRFDDQQDIARYIIENEVKDIKVSELRKLIRKELGIAVSIDELTDQLMALEKSGMIKVEIDEDKVSIEPSTENPRKVQVMYSYEVRPGKGEKLIPNSRDFCKKLIQNDRLYTRTEIQRMSEIFGYSVFEYGGGFYKDPKTGQVTPHCRHRFKPITVAKKRK